MKFSDIKILVLDVDGILTDNLYYISDKGVVTKSFYTRDFYALRIIQEMGIKVFIMTESHDNCIMEQYNRLLEPSKKLMSVHNRVGSKKKEIEDYILWDKNLSWENIAYMGDAENDLECMKVAGITGCPFDAIDAVKEEATFISDKTGGKGCVYDFIQYLLKGIKNESK